VNDPIDSRKLQIFLCLARKGSLKAAAPELSLTNSAVSHAITSLESDLGVQLFHRSGKGLVLTERGEFLYRKAIPVVARMNTIRSELAGENLEDRGTLRIAAAFSFVGSVIPDVVREFNECFPRGQVSIRAAERDVALDLLRTREADAAILVEPPEDGPEFTYQKLFDDEPRLLLPSRNALAALEVVPLRNLAQKTLLVARAQSHTIKTLQAQMARKGVEFRECVEVGSISALCEMVKLGQGVGLAPDWVVRHFSSSPLLVTRPIEGLRLTRTWAFVSAKWSAPNLASRTFLRLCQQAVTGLTAEPALAARAPSTGPAAAASSPLAAA
jgi:LysR family transcriptional regulator for metE and metH